jgi:undecaprenol kinase
MENLVLLAWVTLVLSLELINTAIERAVDLVTKDVHPLAKQAKDVAAGAVLVASVGAAVTALIIFGPRLWNVLY